MPNIDDYPETPKNPGSLERMHERQRLRLARKLNAPVPGPLGLSNYVLHLRKKDSHAVTCQCNDCIPDWLFKEMQTWGPLKKRVKVAEKPYKIITAKSNPPKPRKSRWQNRGGSSN